MRTILLATLMLTVTTAHAQERKSLTLNDAPEVLQRLENCGVIASCKGRAWISVHPGGIVTIFYKTRTSGLDINGSGSTLEAAIRDLASNINDATDSGKDAVKALSPWLPTQ